MPATDYYRDLLIDRDLRAQAVALDATLYMTLLLGDPGRAGSLAQEVSGGSFARVAIASGTGTWAAGTTAGDGLRTSNSAAITFPTPTADWGTITHAALMDNGSTLGAGDMVFYWELDSPRTVLSGDNPPSFAIGTAVQDYI